MNRVRTKRPKVSVILPVYNAEPYIAEAVQSILNQTLPDFELVIVNDGSSDGTEKELGRFLKDPKVRYHAFPHHQGYPAAVNKAVKMARGRFLAFQDADDVSLPERLEEEVRCLEANPKVELVYSHVLEIDKQGKVIRERGGIHHQDTILNVPDAFYRLYLKGNFIPNPTIMMRRRHLRQGLYLEDLPMCNDLEHKIRVAHDYPIFELAKPLLKLRRGHRSMSSSQELSLKTERRIIKLGFKQYRKAQPKLSWFDYRRALSNHYIKEADYYRRVQKKYLSALGKVLFSLWYYPFQPVVWRYLITLPLRQRKKR